MNNKNEAIENRDMTGKVIKVKRIEDIILWKKLKSLGDTSSNTLIGELPTICEEAADLMKVIALIMAML